jgi:hypothetical protein
MPSRSRRLALGARRHHRRPGLPGCAGSSLNGVCGCRGSTAGASRSWRGSGRHARLGRIVARARRRAGRGGLVANPHRLDFVGMRLAHLPCHCLLAARDQGRRSVVQPVPRVMESQNSSRRQKRKPRRRQRGSSYIVENSSTTISSTARPRCRHRYCPPRLRRQCLRDDLAEHPDRIRVERLYFGSVVLIVARIEAAHVLRTRRCALLWRHFFTRPCRAQVQGRFLPQQGFDRPPHGDCRLLDCIHSGDPC